MAGENYRGIWVYAEQQEGRLEPAVFEILAKARQLSAHSGEEVTAVLLGDKVEPPAARTPSSLPSTGPWPRTAPGPASGR